MLVFPISFISSFCVHALIFCVISFVLVSPVSARGDVGRFPATQPWPAHEHRIVIKYGGRIDACAHCLIARRERFSQFTKTGSLDRLHSRFRVKKARGLFIEHHGTGAERRAAMLQAGDDVRGRYPARTARAPFSAASPDLSNIFIVRLGEGVDALAAARAFAADPDVEYAAPDYEVRAAYVPNDPYFLTNDALRPGLPDLWGLYAVEAVSAWDVATGAGITVAVIDTGIKERHRDIRDNIWINPGEVDRNRVDDDGNGYVDDVWGWDFIKDRRKPRDRNGHGTHVAGTIAATADNQRGIAGLAFGARVMSVRAFDKRGRGPSSKVAQAIVYATANGADILSNSWYSVAPPESNPVLTDAIDAAVAAGAVVVLAAGNNGVEWLGQASDPSVIAVAATEYGDTKADFSNYGKNISVSAPGVDILSLGGPRRVGGVKIGRRYRSLSGTSMATPHVSAAAALLLQDQPTLSTDEVRWHLELNADQPGHPGYEGEAWNPMSGWGRVNVARIYDEPPVTIRMSDDPISLHAITGETTPDVAKVDFSFTTHDPVAWSVSAPSWLAPDPASGVGPVNVNFDMDASALTPGNLVGTIDVSASATSSGGASITAGLNVHADRRAGPEVVVHPEWKTWSTPFSPTVLGDGNGTLVVWVQNAFDDPTPAPLAILGAYVDDAGNVTGPFQIYAGVLEFYATRIYDAELELAYDGTNFLVVWVDEKEEDAGTSSLKSEKFSRVKAVRVTSGGAVLDQKPVELTEISEVEGRWGFDKFLTELEAGFDGENFTVIWNLFDFASAKSPDRIYMARVSTDGVQTGAAKEIYSYPGTAPYYVDDAHLSCRTDGTCLITWVDGEGEISPLGKSVSNLYGQRWNGETLVDAAPQRMIDDISWIQDVAASEHGWLVSARRTIYRVDDSPPGYRLYAARIAPDGTVLDPDGISFDGAPPEGYRGLGVPRSVIYDSENYIVRWNLPGPPRVANDGNYAFAARISPGGIVLDADSPGVLLGPSPSFERNDGVLAATATKSLLVRFVLDQDGNGPIIAQGVFAR